MLSGDEELALWLLSNQVLEQEAAAEAMVVAEVAATDEGDAARAASASAQRKRGKEHSPKGAAASAPRAPPKRVRGNIFGGLADEGDTSDAPIAPSAVTLAAATAAAEPATTTNASTTATSLAAASLADDEGTPRLCGAEDSDGEEVVTLDELRARERPAVARRRPDCTRQQEECSRRAAR